MQESVPLSYKAELIPRGAVRHEWDMGPRSYGEGLINSVCSIITDNWLKKSLGLFLTESFKV